MPVPCQAGLTLGGLVDTHKLNCTVTLAFLPVEIMRNRRVGSFMYALYTSQAKASYEVAYYFWWRVGLPNFVTILALIVYPPVLMPMLGVKS